MLAATSAGLWYAIRATGIVALLLLTATTVLGILTAGRLRTPTWPAFAQADLHKRVGVLSLVFLGIHVLTAVVDTYVPVGWLALLVPFASHYRPLWTGFGTLAVDLLAAVAISSALRQRISARTWRGLHWLAYACWPVAVVHALGMGTDAGRTWMVGLVAMCGLGVSGALGWRTATAIRARRRASAVGSVTRAVGASSPPGRPIRGSSSDIPRRSGGPFGSATAVLEREGP